MGGVLVRKNIQPQYNFGTGEISNVVNVGGRRSKGPVLPNMSGTDRSPAQMASIQAFGAQAGQELANLPSPGSIADYTKRQEVGVQRASAKDAMSRGAPTSHYERYGADRFQREMDKGADIDTANRAGIAAAKVGVKGRRFGGKLGGALAGGLGILSAATALDEAGASGQGFDRAITNAGLTGVTTYGQIDNSVTPFLQDKGGAIGSKFASPKYVRPPVAVNPPTTTPPVAVTPSVIPGTGTDSQGRSFSPLRSTVRGEGETFSQAYDAPLTSAQNKERLTAINAQAQNSNMGMTPQMTAEKVGIQRRENPTNVAQPFNPQVQEGAMDMFNAPQQVGVVPGSSRVEPSGSTTVQQGLPGMATPKAEPTNPVKVQQQLPLGPDEASAAFAPPKGGVTGMPDANAAAAQFTGQQKMTQEEIPVVDPNKNQEVQGA